MSICFASENILNQYVYYKNQWKKIFLKVSQSIVHICVRSNGWDFGIRLKLNLHGMFTQFTEGSQ